MRRCQVEGVSWIVLWACCFALQSSPHSPNAAFQNVHISAIDGTLVSWHENKILAPRTTFDLMLWRGLGPESGVSRLSSAAPCWNLRLRGGVILNKDADVIKEGKQLKMEKNRRKLGAPSVRSQPRFLPSHSHCPPPPSLLAHCVCKIGPLFSHDPPRRTASDFPPLSRKS
eukprot:1155060-Rhodomonas_salina.1